MQERKPEIIVFAGPNGSGKSTIKELVNVRSVYINADEINGSIKGGPKEQTQQSEQSSKKNLR